MLDSHLLHMSGIWWDRVAQCRLEGARLAGAFTCHHEQAETEAGGLWRSLATTVAIAPRGASHPSSGVFYFFTEKVVLGDSENLTGYTLCYRTMY
jgi:hypothetical protein